MHNEDQFKPYIPSEKTTPEITVVSIMSGVVLAVVFGAANAYLGLRVGMTVSASVPAAVVSMGVLRILLRRKSILENNIVQTIGSAGESVAAGAIFTIPALFLWASEGRTVRPSMLEITLIALFGGLLGVLFMVPLRNALIVKEHGVLPYPEGSACAEVLVAGEKGGAGTSTVFVGMGISAAYKFIIDGLKIVSSEIVIRIKGFAGEIGTQIYPAVLSVGYICGHKIASYMFAGGCFSWLVLIPAIVLFGGDNILYPGTVGVSELFSTGGADSIWSVYIRYIGAGALATGGFISLIKSFPIILSTFSATIKGLFQGKSSQSSRTFSDLDIKFVLISILIIIVLIWLVPVIPVGLLGASVIVVFGFFFATVSSRMVGLVGSSNNPVSGMSIATVIASALILRAGGSEGTSGMISAITIGSVICIISAISGDTSQDLKTGYILGATPKKQQIGEIIGVVCASVAIGGTLYLLDYAWGFGSEELGAPQAMLMKMLTEGVMEGNLPWTLLLIGVFSAVVIEILGIPVLPFAIGMYLPVHLNTCIMIGGIIRYFSEKKSKDSESANRGLLFCSGMIAGEGLVGILLALLAVFGVSGIFDYSEKVSPFFGDLTSVVLLLFICIFVFKISFRRKKVEK